ncbi:MAG: methionyl-tRNA formyltransferase [Verrucomicrobiales bacterium]|nr:methionyl-tRNA formyltransferase [Verrucomicrobiales bacterium]
MRLVFMGTGEIALPSLRWLIHARDRCDHEIVGVYTQPDKPIGRKQILTPPEVKVIAGAAGIPVFQPETLRKNEEACAEFAGLKPDLAVVMAYGQILPRSIIEAPRIACVNLHASLLPRHRGASPIQAAIRDGDRETGITLMHVIPKLDAGDMILKETIPIESTDTGGILHDKLAELGPALLQRGLPLLRSESFESEPQNEEAVTYSGKLERNDGHLDWNQGAELLERLIRAYDPWPGTFAMLKIGEGLKKLKIFPQTSTAPDSGEKPGTVVSTNGGFRISCGSGSLILNGDMQLEGKKRLPVRDWMRGTQIPVGTILL